MRICKNFIEPENYQIYPREEFTIIWWIPRNAFNYLSEIKQNYILKKNMKIIVD